MAAVERTYNIPLRKEFQKAPPYKRAKKAVAAVREYLKRHMKSDDVLLGPMLNLKIWEHGIKNPPHHVKVKAVKDDKGTVRAELCGFEFKEKEKKEAKKPQAKGLAGKIQQKLEGKQEEKPKEAVVTKKDLKKAEVRAEEAVKPAEDLEEPRAETPKEGVGEEPKPAEEAPAEPEKPKKEKPAENPSD